MAARSTTSRLGACLLALALAGGAAACSSDESGDGAGGGDPSQDGAAEEVAFDDWVASVNAACVEFDETTDAIDEPADESELAGALDESVDALGDLLDEIVAAGTPDQSAAEAAELVASVEELRDIAADAAEAAADDPEAAFELLQTGSERAEEKDVVAEDLGLDECIGG